MDRIQRLKATLLKIASWILTIFKALRVDLGFPGGASGKEPACQCRRHKRHRFNPWVRKIPWRRAWKPTLVSCLENPMDRGVWWPTVHGATKSWTRLKVTWLWH